MNAVGPLFAAGVDWVDVLPLLAFAIIWIVTQVVNIVRRVAGDAGQPPVRPVAPPRLPAPAADVPDVRAELERQIEEFLRQPRGPRQADQVRPPSPARQPVSRGAGPRADRPRRDTAAASRRPPPLPRAEKPPAEPPSRLADRHLEPLVDAGATVGGHVKEAFARDIGRLATPLSAAPPTAVEPASRERLAADLVAALRDPASLRHLVLLRDVLERPVHRWE